jgi:TPR repeat protein
VYEFESCKRGCDEEHDAQSCSFTSNVYRFGEGKGYSGGRDPRSALRYAQRACALRGDRECDTLALDCEARPAVCEEGCAKNQARHCALLPLAVPDRARAAALRRKACDLNPGFCLAGYSASCDYYDPNACIDRCEKGEAEACYWAGALFRVGNSTVHVLRDPDRARRLLRRACVLEPKISLGCDALAAEATETRPTE